jgi:hypothetical protein
MIVCVYLFEICRGFLVNVHHITHVKTVDGVFEVYLAGVPDPVRIEDHKKADMLMAKLETLSR